MKIKHSVETEEGNFVYQGEFTGPELEFLVEFAVNSLLAKGAFPFVHADTAEDSIVPLEAPQMEQ